jgi:hypothetical protein
MSIDTPAPMMRTPFEVNYPLASGDFRFLRVVNYESLH